MTGESSNFANSFGEVRADRIVFNVRKSLLGGTVREDLPVKHITSVRYETKRWPIWGAIFVLIGVALLANGSYLVGLILTAIGVLLIAGVPSVAVNTAGGELRVSLGRPFQNGEAESYASAVRSSVFAE